MKTSKLAMVDACERCAGSKHVLVDGAWRPCSCLEGDRRRRTYTAAKIPARLLGLSWREFLAEYRVIGPGPRWVVRLADGLRKGRREADWVSIHSEGTAPRRSLAALLMRAACDGGLSALMCSIPDAIDYEFKRERIDPAEPDALAIEVGSEPPHKYNAYALERILRTRWAAKKFTILISRQETRRLSRLYGSSEVDELLRLGFTSVGVLRSTE